MEQQIAAPAPEIEACFDSYAIEALVAWNAPDYEHTRLQLRHCLSDLVETAIREHGDWRGVYPGHCVNPETCRGFTHCPRKLSCVE